MFNPIGIVEDGNIDLNNRPSVINGEGYSTVDSTSFTDDDGLEVLIPTVHDDGYMMTPDEAWELYKRTGRHLGKFNTVMAADDYAQRLHEQQSTQYHRPSPAEVVVQAILKGRL